jgi:RimJ/RimL family protein N-acetyltransferase
MTPHGLAASLPDEPRWLELRAMLREPDAIVHGDLAARRCVVVTPWLMGALGQPDVALLRRLDREHPRLDLLAQPDCDAWIRDALPWRIVERAELSLAPERLAPVPCPTHARLGWLEGEALSHLGRTLEGELVAAQRSRRIAAAWVRDRPVAFCFAPWETEGHYDLSIDTLAEHRRRGIATALAAFYLGERPDKRAVWGAIEGNNASQRVADKLGFTRCGSLVVAAGEDSLYAP